MTRSTFETKVPQSRSEQLQQSITLTVSDVELFMYWEIRIWFGATLDSRLPEAGVTSTSIRDTQDHQVTQQQV